MQFDLYNGDCLDVLKTLPDNSIDSIVSDPPYGLNFMGKKWDCSVPSVAIWEECLRVLKPGGHMLAFAGTRTQHRMAVNIEDAGFEIRDMIAWCYGSGFPKSMDVSKAIDKAAGAVRERVAGPKTGGMSALNKGNARHGYRDSEYYEDGNMMLSSNPATEAARQWQGFGTALKPALEPITVARKPLIGTVAANVLEHSTGAINIDGCRVEIDASVDDPRLGGNGTWSSIGMAKNVYNGGYSGERVNSSPLGRFPANFIHDGSDDVLALFPDSKGAGGPLPNTKVTGYGNKNTGTGTTDYVGGERIPFESGSGSAARFFYCAKASNADRNSGLDEFEPSSGGSLNMRNDAHAVKNGQETTPRANNHPTVKPCSLMRYLCRLVTPKGGKILDPFVGSGSTGKAAVLEGFDFIGIDLDSHNVDISRARIQHALDNREFYTDDGKVSKSTQFVETSNALECFLG